jgi:histidine decarboxylase
MEKIAEQMPTGETALAPEDRKQFDEMLEFIREQARTFVGYPCRGYFDYSELFDFLYYPVNNVGDPYAPCTYRVHTREIERQVVGWFAQQNHIEEDQFWGYVTNGGTEGNIYGLFLARELYPSGMVYYSEDTHYSVSKNLRVLNMKHIMIKSQPNGEMDYEDLRRTIEIHRDVPPIIFANIGTTMTEAKDDIQHIKSIMDELAIHQSYIHVDAALCGMTLPFADDAPIYDFRAGIDSLSISGHKFIGAPFPCGIVLAKKEYVNRIARSIEYVGTLDTTLTGSRNGVAALFLWYAIKKIGVDGFRQEVAGCRERARYAVERFREVGIEAWMNPCSITVVFERPPESILRKWQIAVHHGWGHIVVMQTISREQIDELIEDIRRARDVAPREEP